jgi:hypothetical protein
MRGAPVAAAERMPCKTAAPAVAGDGRRSIGGMWLRRAFFGWMFPSAFLLPVWLLVGWIAFEANGWALLWVLFLAMPSVFFGQLILALLVRARGTVRTDRAVSWLDVGGFALWHALIVATGFFASGWSAAALVGAIVAAVALFWSTLWQLWQEARGGARILLRTADGAAYLPPRPRDDARRSPAAGEAEVIVVAERRS